MKDRERERARAREQDSWMGDGKVTEIDIQRDT